MTDYQKYINALRKCANEHKNDKTFTGHIIVSDLCQDTANLLEELEQKPKQKIGQWIAGEYWSMGSGMGESYGYWYTCSECGNKIRGGYSECGDNYCSKCGAKMSEESKECCYNKDDECQLGYGKCSSISKCFTLE